MIEWRQIQRQNFTCWKKLAEFLELDPVYFPAILKDSHFPLNLPLRLAQKIQKNRWDDPILRQFLPLEIEKEIVPGFQQDPVGDFEARKSSKLLKKYQGRALLVCTSSCAMNCRFCFRQNYDYETQDKEFDEELERIRQDSSLTEIILSGGDPLSLSNETLSRLIERLDVIPHLERLRFHTRFPVGIPERIDEGFLSLLAKTNLQIFFVIHTNHPGELDAQVAASLKKIQKLGIPVLNQTVLLRGVNDHVSTLKELCEKLARHGILPYYLHQLDRVQGSSHFEVSEEEGRALIAQLTELMSGYAVPKYVKEEAGEPSKTPLLDSISSACN
ncbi:MAG: KamA family radical SAM protein [Verrucomicrobia bacterium]|nr:KamA family radical SAM protein [Verrucomicrobiota bacterium]